MKNILAVVLGLAIAMMASSLASPPPANAAQMPTDPAEAARVFEAEVDKWNRGPVSYLFTQEEQKIWKKLRDDDEKREFIRWFWQRRNDDTRDDQTPFMVGFYTRVAYANKRFPGFPRGWRSDRGRAWIILGRPDSIRAASTGLEVWTYFTGRLLAGESYADELQVAFARRNNSTWEIYGSFGAGVWPTNVLQSFEIVNMATVRDPFLERKR